jgi:hypothetical protein
MEAGPGDNVATSFAGGRLAPVGAIGLGGVDAAAATDAS